MHMATDFLITVFDQEDWQTNNRSNLIIERERENISSEIIQPSTFPFLLNEYIPEKGGNPIRVMVRECKLQNQFIYVIFGVGDFEISNSKINTLQFSGCINVEKRINLSR